MGFELQNQWHCDTHPARACWQATFAISGVNSLPQSYEATPQSESFLGLFPFLTRLERLRAGRKINCLSYYKVAKIHLKLEERAELSLILAEGTKHLRAFEWRTGRSLLVRNYMNAPPPLPRLRYYTLFVTCQEDCTLSPACPHQSHSKNRMPRSQRFLCST